MSNWKLNLSEKQLREAEASSRPVGGRTGHPAPPTRAHPQYIYSNLPFVATTNQTAALSANPNRIFLMVQNQGTIPIYVSAGSPQGAMSITPAGSITLDIFAPNNDIYIYTLTGSSVCAVMQGMRQ